LGGVYPVQNGHHRVSVAHFHGVEWMDAEVTEFWSPKGQVAVPAREHSADVASSPAR
jgi:hypothetical protein